VSIGEYSVTNKVVSWLLVIIMVGGGIWGFRSMGKLEDPAFTIKLAKIITLYPGASAQQVQDEVTYNLEDAIQRMEQVRHIKMSISRPGMSDITIEFKDKYRAEDFPAIYDELRRKIADMRGQLPPGVQDPIIVDDFADVYGIYVALTGEGYSWRDLWDAADRLKKEIVLVDGVRKVSIDGAQREVVYVEIPRSNFAELGISPGQIGAALQSQNLVVESGRISAGSERLRIWPTGEADSVSTIGDILISSAGRKLLYLRDIAAIWRAYEEVPNKLYYVNGKPALTMGISMAGGENVVAVGQALDRRLAELQAGVPAGMELVSIYDQPKEVDNSVNGFLVSVAQAVTIVLVVLLLFMGVRTGIIIGAVLLITVAGTLFVMAIFGIELHRISLGALIIALGMLVDNGIVVAEGMLVRMQAGMSALQAAGEAVGKTIWALLGGTVIGILAFAGIGFSQDATGEFIGSLFQVILISLMLSWVTAISRPVCRRAFPGLPRCGGLGAAQSRHHDRGGGPDVRAFGGRHGQSRPGAVPAVKHPHLLRGHLGARGVGHPGNSRGHAQGGRIPAAAGRRDPDHVRGRRAAPAVHAGVRLQGGLAGLWPDHRADGNARTHPRHMGRGAAVPAGGTAPYGPHYQAAEHRPRPRQQDRGALPRPRSGGAARAGRAGQGDHARGPGVPGRARGLA
jgi:multidrug efflux pump subunit AcrB